ncbi:uncharacterized protein DEA37_0011184 [Paragonimus westermani]|uniref:Uncharacterized protein n=1 Tax=Paragonimus westermani TaxID=34504 RepID=A0A5J4NKI2_9TREM|nr:uncharacterized protein DEA37_0011184 [Paragonimus westermani]
MEPIPVRTAAKDYLARYVNPTLLKGLTENAGPRSPEPAVLLRLRAGMQRWTSVSVGGSKSTDQSAILQSCGGNTVEAGGQAN